MGTMRLGLIADIHADYEAMLASIDLLLGQGVDKIVCLGDLVEKGYQGDACVHALQTYLIPCVRGNHDELAIINQADSGDDPRWQALNPHTQATLQRLPLTLDYLYEGYRLLLCHGTPDDTWTYCHPNWMPAKQFKTIAARNDADIILCGHTHRPMDVCYAGVRFLNPGSVCGRQSAGSRTCAVLTLPTLEFQVFDLP